MKTKIWKSIALMTVTLTLLLTFTGCPTGTSSSGNGVSGASEADTGIDQKSFDVLLRWIKSLK